MRQVLASLHENLNRRLARAGSKNPTLCSFSSVEAIARVRINLRDSRHERAHTHGRENVGILIVGNKPRPGDAVAALFHYVLSLSLVLDAVDRDSTTRKGRWLRRLTTRSRRPSHPVIRPKLEHAARRLVGHRMPAGCVHAAVLRLS